MISPALDVLEPAPDAAHAPSTAAQAGPAAATTPSAERPTLPDRRLTAIGGPRCKSADHVYRGPIRRVLHVLHAVK